MNKKSLFPWYFFALTLLIPYETYPTKHKKTTWVTTTKGTPEAPFASHHNSAEGTQKLEADTGISPIDQLEENFELSTKPKSKALQYLEQQEFPPEGYFTLTSFSYRTSILSQLRNKSWTNPEGEALTCFLQQMEYALQECVKKNKYERLGEILMLCAQRGIVPNHASLQTIYPIVSQEKKENFSKLQNQIKTFSERLRLLTAIQKVIQENVQTTATLSNEGSDSELDDYLPENILRRYEFTQPDMQQPQ